MRRSSHAASRRRGSSKALEQHGPVVVALDESLQLGAALHKRQVEQVPAVQVEQVERP